MSRIFRTDFLGDPNLGLYGFATEKYCVLGPRIRNRKNIEDALGVKTIESKMLGTDLAGIFSAGNSHGIVVPAIIENHETEILEKKLDVLVIESNYTALGNLILMNDKGCIISGLIKNQKERIERFFGMDCEVSEASIAVIGSAAIATNSGCVFHPNLGERGVRQIERLLDVNAESGTANFGSPFVGACLIANSRGLVVSEHSTGIEVSRIEQIIFPES